MPGSWLFFPLTFTYTWTFWIAAALSGRELTEFPVFLLFALGGIGPSLTAVILVHRIHEPETRRDFWRRVVDFHRIAPWWYGVMAGIAVIPLALGIAVALGVGRQFDDVAAWPSAVLLGAVAFNLAASLAEELGWRGYAQDRLQQRTAALTIALVVGVFWAVWHVPLYFIEGTFQNEHGFASSQFWLLSISIVALSVLLAWVYNNTGRSILAAIVLHWIVNLAGEAFSPEGLAEGIRTGVTVALALLVIALLAPRDLTTRRWRRREQ